MARSGRKESAWQCTYLSPSLLATQVDFTGAAIEKAIELNEKYAIVDKTTEALGNAATKIKDQIKEAQA